MTRDVLEHETAHELLQILRTGRQCADVPVADMASAGKITHQVRVLREARGERVVGRKIGFSNRSIWPIYGVDRPMWNYVWDTTLIGDADPERRVDLTGFPEPRIEPEIVFHLAEVPKPGMDETAILACIDRVAHGFEIVQSVFPGWKFTAAQSAAAFGLHGVLILGPWQDARKDRDTWGQQLADFTVRLRKGGSLVEVGHARNVLGGPLTALRYLVDALEVEPEGAALQPGELVTTGTLTDAHPVVPGDVWSTEFDGIGLTGLQVSFV